MKKRNSVLRKLLAVSLAAAMLAGTGFTVAGQYVGTDISVNAAEELVASRYSIIGTFTEWGGATPDVPSDIPMYETEQGVYIGKTGIIPAGDHAFKVRMDGKWAVSYAAYDEEYDVTRNSTKNIEVTLTENAAIAVMLDTRGDNSDLWPLSYAIVKNDSEEYQWIYTGKGKSPWEEKPAVNDEEESDANDFAYDSNSYTDKVLITGYNGDGGDIVIPKTIDGKTVYGIQSKAFSNCTNITSITIPDTVKSIYSDAFNGCTNLMNIIVDENNTVYSSDNGMLLNKEKTYLYAVASGVGDYVIPDSIKEISPNLFRGSVGLKSIEIPDSVTFIYNNTFKDCINLKSVKLSNRITGIGEYAFSGCTSLENITIPDSVTSLWKYAFSGCTSLTNITIPENMYEIDEGAFSGCTGLTSITIPNKVSYMGSNAFYGCTGLKNVTIGKGIEDIKWGTFNGCDNLENIAVDKNNTKYCSVDGVLLNKDKTVIVVFPKNKKGEYVIPDTITSINGTFLGCAGLTSIKIPNTVTTIGDYTFSGCTGLTNITIPDSVTYLGNYVFQDCTGLKSLTIGSGVTMIAFSDWEKLENITVSEDNTVYSSDNGVLLNKDKTKILYCPKAKTGSYEMPDSVTGILSGAFTDCGITSMLIGKNFTGSLDCFKDYKNIEKITVSPDNSSYSSSNGVVLNKEKTKIVFCPLGKKGSYTIPRTVTSIGGDVFKNRTGLTKITIPDSVTSIGQSAFSGCTGLTSINIPNGVRYIEYSTFQGCTGLTNITIPDSVTSIGNYAFDGCTSLASINIPDSVTYIGSSAFNGCTGLTNITIPDGVAPIGDSAFFGCTGLTSINIPNGVRYIEYSTFQGCTGLTNITIPDSVTSIGNSAFDGCTGLTSISIPDSVTQIGEYAFNNCTSLADITIGSGLKQIGSAAFENCPGIENITVSANNTTFASHDGALLNKNKTFFRMFPKSKKGTYTVPDSMTEIDGYIFTGSSVDKVILPESVTYISDYAFSSSSLKSIVIPDSVESIGAFAFSDCNSLLSVTIGSGVTEIDETAFGNSPNLKIYGEKGSYAETYANENKIPFVSELMNDSAISATKIILGRTVTVNAKAILGSGNYTYAVFYKKKSESKWTTRQDFSTNDTVTIKPAYATEYDVCVKAKDSDGTIAKKYFTVKVNSKLSNTSALSAENIVIGQKVTANCLAQGGMGEYQYQVVYKQTSQTKWTTAQAFSENTSVTFKPAKATTYDVCVKVKDSNGTIVKKFFTVQVNAKLTNTSAVSSATIKKGGTVAVNGSATGGVGDYTYAIFYKQKAQTKWTTKQNFNDNADVSITPTQVADYDICVKVKDKDGTIVKKYFTVTVTK